MSQVVAKPIRFEPKTIQFGWGYHEVVMGALRKHLTWHEMIRNASAFQLTIAITSRLGIAHQKQKVAKGIFETRRAPCTLRQLIDFAQLFRTHPDLFGGSQLQEEDGPWHGKDVGLFFSNKSTSLK